MPAVCGHPLCLGVGGLVVWEWGGKVVCVDDGAGEGVLGHGENVVGGGGAGVL